MILRCQDFPLKLFSLLHAQDGQELAEQILEEGHFFPCRLDEFSRGHIEKYNTPVLLQSEDSLATLSAVSLDFIGCIHSTESLHSKNSLRTKGRQTSQMALRTLAAWHPVHAAPQWMDKSGADSPFLPSCQWSLSSRQCHHSSTEESWCSQDPHVRTCSMGPQWNTLVQSIATADDDCHMVPQLGGCEQVPVLDAVIACSIW